MAIPNEPVGDGAKEAEGTMGAFVLVLFMIGGGSSPSSAMQVIHGYPTQAACDAAGKAWDGRVPYSTDLGHKCVPEAEGQIVARDGK